MDFRLIPDSLRDTEKTEYLLRDMPVNQVVQITREALRKVDYGTRNTYNIELWVRNEYDKQGTIEYLKHIINRGKLYYSDIISAFKLYNPFLELDPSRPIDWMDTLMKEKKKEEVFLTDDFEYVPVPKKIVITNPRWEHKDATKKENSPNKATFDDTVILMADITGLPENGPVTFEIFNISVKPPKAVANAKGKNVGGVAKGEWFVTDTSGTGEESDIEFQAVAKSKTSTRCKIHCMPVTKTYEIIVYDLLAHSLQGSKAEVHKVAASCLQDKPITAGDSIQFTNLNVNSVHVKIVHQANYIIHEEEHPEGLFLEEDEV